MNDPGEFATSVTVGSTPITGAVRGATRFAGVLPPTGIVPAGITGIKSRCFNALRRLFIRPWVERCILTLIMTPPMEFPLASGGRSCGNRKRS